MTAVQTLETTNKKVVRTVREFCQKTAKQARGHQASMQCAPLFNKGSKALFASAILRYNRRVLIDQVAWDACLARLSQSTTNMPIKEVGDAKETSKDQEAFGSCPALIRVSGSNTNGKKAPQSVPRKYETEARKVAEILGL